MALYSRQPLRAARQLFSDLFVVVWVVVWVQLGQAVNAAVNRLQTPLTTLEDGARSVSQNLAAAGDQATRVPLVGEELARPLDRAAESMGRLAGAGADQALAVQEAAWWAAFAVVAVPVACLLLVWLPPRARFVAASVSTHRLSGQAGGDDLLALRALVRSGSGQLHRISPDPVAAWRSGDPRVVAALADLELARSGLRRPLPSAGGSIRR